MRQSYSKPKVGRSLDTVYNSHLHFSHIFEFRQNSANLDISAIFCSHLEFFLLISDVVYHKHKVIVGTCRGDIAA